MMTPIMAVKIRVDPIPIANPVINWYQIDTDCGLTDEEEDGESVVVIVVFIVLHGFLCVIFPNGFELKNKPILILIWIELNNALDIL